MEIFINQVVEFFQGMGYWGIICMMLLEASFIPFPSEVAMIPAGYMVSQGIMDFSIAVGAGIFGSILGSSVNFFLGRYLGREFLERYGKYIFVSRENLEKMDLLFKRRGKAIVFWGRLVPVVRQYISFPPGIAKMSYFVFTAFTALGSGLWVAFLVYLGYFYGNNQGAINEMILKFKYLCAGSLFVGLAYALYRGRKKRMEK